MQPIGLVTSSLVDCGRAEFPEPPHQTFVGAHGAGGQETGRGLDALADVSEPLLGFFLVTERTDSAYVLDQDFEHPEYSVSKIGVDKDRGRAQSGFSRHPTKGIHNRTDVSRRQSGGGAPTVDQFTVGKASLAMIPIGSPR